MTEQFGPAVEVNAAPPHVEASSDRLWAILGHAGVLFISFLAPLVVMLTRGKESPWVRAQAVESLNFQITVAIAMAASMVMVIGAIGALTGFVVGVAAFVLPIVAALRTYRGEDYRYPFTIRLVK